MQWMRDNIVGLLAIILVMGASYVTLYIKVAVNTEAISQVKTQLSNFTDTNNRLIISLDKLDLLYNEARVKDAVQDERITQLTNRTENLEKK